jgi:hypothetical protein
MKNRNPVSAARAWRWLAVLLLAGPGCDSAGPRHVDKLVQKPQRPESVHVIVYPIRGKEDQATTGPDASLPKELAQRFQRTTEKLLSHGGYQISPDREGADLVLQVLCKFRDSGDSLVESGKPLTGQEDPVTKQAGFRASYDLRLLDGRTGAIIGLGGGDHLGMPTRGITHEDPLDQFEADLTYHQYSGACLRCLADMHVARSAGDVLVVSPWQPYPGELESMPTHDENRWGTFLVRRPSFEPRHRLFIEGDWVDGGRTYEELISGSQDRSPVSTSSNQGPRAITGYSVTSRLISGIWAAHWDVVAAPEQADAIVKLSGRSYVVGSSPVEMRYVEVTRNAAGEEISRKETSLGVSGVPSYQTDYDHEVTVEIVPRGDSDRHGYRRATCVHPSSYLEALDSFATSGELAKLLHGKGTAGPKKARPPLDAPLP